VTPVPFGLGPATSRLSVADALAAIASERPMARRMAIPLRGTARRLFI
jgi:hypothetical protein